MRQFLFGLVTAAALCGVVALSRSSPHGRPVRPPTRANSRSRAGDKNPWTSLKLNNDPDQLRSPSVSDRTGGHRDKVFRRPSRA